VSMFKKNIDLGPKLEKLWSEISINDLVWLIIYSKQELVQEKARKKLRANDEWDGISTENLILLLMHSKEESIEKKAWEKLKASGKLTSTNMFDLTDGPKFIQKELSKMFFGQASHEDLVEAIESVPDFTKKAKTKLFSLIRKGKINKGPAKDILIRLIEKIQPLRQEALELLAKKLCPSEAELRKILDMKALKDDTITQIAVQDLIRKVAKENRGSIMAQEIERFEKQTQESKKE